MKTTTLSVSHRRSSRHQQRGVTLFFGMLFLLTIVLLTLGGVAMSRYQQRLALAMNDREVAFQSATLALRAAEVHVDINSTSSETKTRSGDNSCGSSTDLNDLAKEVICNYAATTPENFYAQPKIQWPRLTIALSSEDLKGVDSKNKDLIKLKSFEKSENDFSGLYPTYKIEQLDPAGHLFRITAVGWGRLPGTQVRLQENYSRPL